MFYFLLIFTLFSKLDVTGSKIVDFGTPLSLNLHNFLSPRTLCRQKIFSNGIHSENLPHTKGIPIEVGLLDGNNENRTMSKIFKDRRWTCVNVIIYCNYNDTNQHNYYWAGNSNRIYKLLQNINVGYKYVENAETFKLSLAVYDYFSILVIMNVVSEVELWKSWEPTHPGPMPTVFPNFKILLLKKTNVTICAHSKLFSVLSKINFICQRKISF